MNVILTSTSVLVSVWISLLWCIIVLLNIVAVEASTLSAGAQVTHTPEHSAILFTKFIAHIVWNYGTNDDIVNFWECAEEREDDSLIPTEEVWTYLRYTYERTMNRTVRSPTADDNALDGFHVDYDIVHHPERGRGLVTKQPIQAGEVVYRPIYSAVFHAGEEYRRYLQALPPYLVCDIMNWSYIRYNEEREPTICVDLDAASMVNECDTDEECNLVPAKGMGRFTGCHLELVAERDLAAGEELVMDYGFSEGPAGWVPLGLLNPEDVDDSRSGNRVDLYYDEAAKRYEDNEF